MRAMVTQSYPLHTAEKLIAADKYPRQLLWGADHLRDTGWDVKLATARRDARLGAVSTAFGEKAGGLYQQASMLRPHDVVVSGRAQVVRGISMARARGLWRTPIVAVFHNHVPQQGRAVASWIRGVDVALCLTTAAQTSLVVDHGRSPETTPLVTWGPDLTFRGYASTGSDFILSSGKDNRDTSTLIQALENIDFPARVYGATGTPASGSPHIQVVSPASGRSQFEYHEVIADLQKAAVVAIPIEGLDRLTGLTEINDALALGKPIVMTRTPGHLENLDIEAHGFGVYIRPGDVEHWSEVLQSLADNPARRRAMGQAARAYAETTWNYSAFCEQLDSGIKLALNRR